METRRTGQFLRFALGARSPDRQYFKCKLYTAPGEARLKIRDDGGVNQTMYDNGLNNSLAQYRQPRAKTTKDGRGVAGRSIDNEGGEIVIGAQ